MRITARGTAIDKNASPDLQQSSFGYIGCQRAAHNWWEMSQCDKLDEQSKANGGMSSDQGNGSFSANRHHMTSLGSEDHAAKKWRDKFEGGKICARITQTVFGSNFRQQQVRRKTTASLVLHRTHKTPLASQICWRGGSDGVVSTKRRHIKQGVECCLGGEDKRKKRACERVQVERERTSLVRIRKRKRGWLCTLT